MLILKTVLVGANRTYDLDDIIDIIMNQDAFDLSAMFSR